MKKAAITAYFDVGTTNMRLYLLGSQLEVLHCAKRNIGARNAALKNDRQLMIRNMKQLYDEVLATAGYTSEQVDAIYASGMVTSRYGVVEVPHLRVPASEKDLDKGMVCFYDSHYFLPELWLIPGLKAAGFDSFDANIVRGEEIECFGALEMLDELGTQTDVALIFPGSHTQILYVRDGKIVDILSTFTGELFCALREETILGDLLGRKIEKLDPLFVNMGREYEQELGFNRALYICNAMQALGQYQPQQQYSYAEGVIHSGVVKALTHKCATSWTDCHTVAVAGDGFQNQLYRALLADNRFIQEIIWLPLTGNESYGVKGLRRILRKKGKDA